MVVIAEEETPVTVDGPKLQWVKAKAKQRLVASDSFSILFILFGQPGLQGFDPQPDDNRRMDLKLALGT